MTQLGRELLCGKFEGLGGLAVPIRIKTRGGAEREHPEGQVTIRVKHRRAETHHTGQQRIDDAAHAVLAQNPLRSTHLCKAQPLTSSR